MKGKIGCEAFTAKWMKIRSAKRFQNEMTFTEINEKPLKYMGHAIRHSKTSLMSSVLMGKEEGKRKRGRPAKNLRGRSNMISHLF